MQDIPVISEHDSWISLDPILGCPASCEYCYLHAYGLTSRKPQQRVTPNELLDLVVHKFGVDGPRWGGRSSTPLPMCIGNYTDLFMTDTGRRYLLDYTSLHARTFPNHPVCIVSKARLKEDDVRELDKAGHPVLFFLSQSFIKSEAELRTLERGPTSLPSDTLVNARILSATKNIIPLHFWRPLTQRTLPNLETAVLQLEGLKNAGVRASIAIGLKCGPAIQPQFSRLAPLFGDVQLPEAGQYLEKNVEERALRAGREINYPVYRHTSCAIALALQQCESLGTWRAPTRLSKCEPCSCPSSQRVRCDDASKADAPPPEEVLALMADDLGMARDDIRWLPVECEVDVAGTVSQDTHAKWTHLTGQKVRAVHIMPSLAWRGGIAGDQ